MPLLEKPSIVSCANWSENRGSAPSVFRETLPSMLLRVPPPRFTSEERNRFEADVPTGSVSIPGTGDRRFSHGKLALAERGDRAFRREQVLLRWELCLHLFHAEVLDLQHDLWHDDLGLPGSACRRRARLGALRCLCPEDPGRERREHHDERCSHGHFAPPSRSRAFTVQSEVGNPASSLFTMAATSSGFFASCIISAAR